MSGPPTIAAHFGIVRDDLIAGGRFIRRLPNFAGTPEQQNDCQSSLCGGQGVLKVSHIRGRLFFIIAGFVGWWVGGLVVGPTKNVQCTISLVSHRVVRLV